MNTRLGVITTSAILALFAVSLVSGETDALSGSGSGFFVTTDGHFITSFHVVAGASKIQIRVGETLYDARVTRSDPANDIALLKVEGEFIPLPLGSPANVAIGDDVFTIGFPAPQIEGLMAKFTKGDISAVSGLGDDPRFFQISIPVQPGNSGGPLIDGHGNVVGIIAHTLSPKVAIAQGFLPQNVNYAVKAAYVLPLIESTPDARGKLVRPVTSSTRSASQIREEVQKSIGLVLVYVRQAETVPKKAQVPTAEGRPRSPRTAANSSSTPVMEVTIRNSAGGLAFIGRTNPAGAFATTGSLKPGDYVVLFRSPNLSSDRRIDIVVTVGKARIAAAAVPGEKFTIGGVAIRARVAKGQGVSGRVTDASVNPQ